MPRVRCYETEISYLRARYFDLTGDWCSWNTICSRENVWKRAQTTRDETRRGRRTLTLPAWDLFLSFRSLLRSRYTVLASFQGAGPVIFPAKRSRRGGTCKVPTDFSRFQKRFSGLGVTTWAISTRHSLALSCAIRIFNNRNQFNRVDLICRICSRYHALTW